MVLATEATDTERLLLAVGIVFLVGPVLATRLRLPGLIGLVIGGTVIGAEGLGILDPGELDGLGDIGLLYLMFTAGLELDLPTFARYRSAAIGFGATTFTLPFLLGMGAGFILDFEPEAAVLIGSIWASHTLVAYPEARQAGLATNRAVTTAVGATAMTDTLALIVLAVVAATQEGGSPETTIAKLAVGVVVLGFTCLWIYPRAGRWLFTHVARDRVSRWVLLLIAFTGAAVLAEQFAIEGLVGAFFAGIGMNRLVPNTGGLMERVEFIGSAFFVPAFLVFVGTQLDPDVLLEPSTWRTAGLFMAALVIGKALAAYLTGRRLHFVPAEIGIMFSLTLAQAAATLAATLVGQSIGLFDAEVVNAVVVVVLLSILVASIGTRAFAARIEIPVAEHPPVGTDVIVALPDGDHGGLLVDLGGDIAVAAGGSLTAVRPVVDNDLDAARAAVTHAVQRATARGADADGSARLADSAVAGILRATDEHGGSMVLMQWSLRSAVAELLTPSDVDRVGAAAKVPVAAALFGGRTIERVVAGLSADSPIEALDCRLVLEVADLAARGRGVPLVTVVEDGDHLDDLVDAQDVTHLTVADQQAMTELLQPADLLVLPVKRAQQAFSGEADLVATSVSGLSILVVGGPGRFRVSTAPSLTGGGVRGSADP